jgi:hypothetical protein
VALSDGQFELAIERLVALGVQGVDDELNGEDRWRQLAAALSGLAEAAGHLSDRLTTRHFSHLDLDVCLVAT